MTQLDLFDSGATHMRRNYIRQIQRTVETYDLELRVGLELLQNAIDSIRRNKSVDRGLIVLDIDVPNNRITVTDNGVGFPHQRDLLFLGGTNKSDDPDQVGRIGVGLKAVIFSSRRFEIKSRTASYDFHFEVRNAADALAEAARNADAALTPSALTQTPPLDDAATGTQVTVEFTGQLVADWVKSMYQAVFEVEELSRREGEAAQLLWRHGSPFKTKLDAMLALYLQTAPYTGDVKQLLIGGRIPIDIQLRLDVGRDESRHFAGEDWADELFPASGKHDVRVECKYADFEALLRAVPSSKRRSTLYIHAIPPGGGNLGDSVRDHVWINKLRTLEEVQSLLTDKSMGVHWEGLESLRDKIRGIYVVLGAPDILRSFIPGGPVRVLSARGVRTAHSFITPRSARHELFVPRIHMIVDVDEDLNYGKRHLNNTWLVKRANDFFSTAYSNTLFTATSQLSSDIRKPNNPNDRSYVGWPSLGFESSIVKIPAVEQDVIALFFDLLGRGILQGYHIYGMSQIEMYDGRFLALRGREKSLPIPTSDDRLYALEFKFDLAGLIRDIEDGRKSSGDIDLAIAWDIHVSDASDRFRLLDTDVSQLGRDDLLLPHVTQVLLDSRDRVEIQVIALKQLLEVMIPSSNGEALDSSLLEAAGP